VVKDKIVLEIVDLVKWVAAAANDDDDDDDDALNQLLASRAVSQVDRDGSSGLSSYHIIHIHSLRHFTQHHRN